MSVSLSVVLSAQMALQQRLETIASNLANASTAGFRAEKVSFATLLSRGPRDPIAFAGRGETHMSLEAGEVQHTGNPLDLALRGDAWFGIETPGGPAYTRDGRLQVTAAGELVTLNGARLLDSNGSPIQVDPKAGPLTIGSSGLISQAGNTLARIGLFTIAPDATLTRLGNNAVRAVGEVQPVTDHVAAGVMQGYVEAANVDAVTEMTHLVAVSRAFEAANSLMEDAERRLESAIKTIPAG